MDQTGNDINMNSSMAGGGINGINGIIQFSDNVISLWVIPFTKLDPIPTNKTTVNFNIKFEEVAVFPDRNDILNHSPRAIIKTNINKYADIFTELEKKDSTIEEKLKGLPSDLNKRVVNVFNLVTEFKQITETAFTDEQSDKFNQLIKPTLDILPEDWAEVREIVLKTVRSYVKFRLEGGTAQNSLSEIQLSTNCIKLAQNYYGLHQKIFSPGDNNERIFDDVCSGRIDKFFKGENTLLFAYGYSGSGKTYTFIGTEKNGEDKALLPRTIEKMVNKLKEHPGHRIDIDIINLMPSRDGSRVEVYDNMNNGYKEFYETSIRLPKQGNVKNRVNQGNKADAQAATERLTGRTAPSEFESNKHLKTISITQDKNSEDIIKEIQTKIDNIMDEKRNKKDVLPTPNNPESSRFFFFVTFTLFDDDTLKNKFTIVDMAGSEDVNIIKRYYVENEREILYKAIKKTDTKPYNYTISNFTPEDIIRGTFKRGVDPYNPGNKNGKYYTFLSSPNLISKIIDKNKHHHDIQGYITPETGTSIVYENKSPNSQWIMLNGLKDKDSLRYSSILFLMINDLLHRETELMSNEMYALKVDDDNIQYSLKIINTFNNFIIQTIKKLEEDVCIDYKNIQINKDKNNKLKFSREECSDEKPSSLRIINDWKTTLNRVFKQYEIDKNHKTCLDTLLKFIYYYIADMIDQGEGINKCISHKQFMFLHASKNLEEYNKDRNDKLKFNAEEYKKFHMYPLLAYLAGASEISETGDPIYRNTDNGEIPTKFIAIVLVKLDNNIIMPDGKVNENIAASLKFAQNIGSLSAGLKDTEIYPKCAKPFQKVTVKNMKGGGTRKKLPLYRKPNSTKKLS